MQDNHRALIVRSLKRVAEYMCVAAHTAPKARGVNNIVTRVLTRPSDIKRLAAHMQLIARQRQKPGFQRDALNVRAANIVVLVGTRLGPLNLSCCGLCGWPDCEALRRAGGRCAFNGIDLGIAVGSAVGVANNFHVDNRIMYSAGISTIALNLFRDGRVGIALAVPLSATGKNPFFDRPTSSG